MKQGLKASRSAIVAGISLYALVTAQSAFAQSCDPGPVCTIDNSGSIGAIIGAQGTATIVTNSGTITGTPAIDQGQSPSLFVDNQTGGIVDGDIRGVALLKFGVRNAGQINGSVRLNDDSGPYLFSAKSIYYIADGGEVSGNVELGTNGFNTGNFIQRGADSGVDNIISAGLGLDIYTKSYSTSQSVALGQYALPASFEIEGYEALGSGTTLTLTGSGTSITVMGEGTIINDGTIDLVDASGLYPTGTDVVPAAVNYYSFFVQPYRRHQIPLGNPGSFYGIGYGNALADFTNNGTINGDVRLQTATFTNSGAINLSSHAPGSVIYSAADQAFLFRNGGDIVMSDDGARPAGAAAAGEFEYGTDHAIRISTAIDSTVPASVAIENLATGTISGGLAVSGFSSDFTFDNAGLISIGDNPVDIDRAVEIDMIEFFAARDPELHEDVVSQSATLTNSGTLDGGIEAGFTTRALSFTNSGNINSDTTDPYAAAVELELNDWPAEPGGEDILDGDSLTFDNSGTITGSIEIEGDATDVTITNTGSITQALRPGHTVTVDEEAAPALALEQETTLGSTTTFTNSGSISNADYGGAAVALSTEAGNVSSGVPGADVAPSTVTVTNSGSIVASGGNYVTPGVFLGLGQNDVAIRFAVGLAINADAEGVSSVSITNQQGGLIESRGPGHYGSQNGPVALPNQPPEAGGLAVAVRAQQLTLVNHGTIRGATPGGELVANNGGAVLPYDYDVDFQGRFGGAIDTFEGADDITNSADGVIEGGVALRDGDDIFRNYGSFTGNLHLGAGNDLFIQGINALFSGTADGGEGEDEFRLELTGGGTIDGSLYDRLVDFELLTTTGSGAVDIEGSEGDDALANEGEIDGDVSLEEGDDDFTNDGTVTGTVALGSGENSLNNSGTIEQGVTTGDDANTVTNGSGGTINGGITTGNGNNTLTNNGGGTINGGITTGDGNNQIGNSGSVSGGITTGNGNNSVTNNSGGTITGTIQTGTGDDSLINNGTINGNINLDGGPPPAFGLLALAPLAAPPATTGGDDVLTSSGTINGSVNASAGDDEFTLSGEVTGNIDMGGDDDTLILTGGWSIGGFATGGDGADTLDVTLGSGVTDFDSSNFTSFETLAFGGGTGRVGAGVTLDFDQIDVDDGYLFGLASSTINGDITVGVFGTFGSAGTVNGDIAVDGTLSPGASPGTLTINGDLALNGSSTTLFEMTPTVSDAIVINGALDIETGATLQLTGTRPLTPGVAYDLITASGGITGQFAASDIVKASTVEGYISQGDFAIQLLGIFQLDAGASQQSNLTVDYLNGLLISGAATSGILADVSGLLSGSGFANQAAIATISPEAYASAVQLGIENGLTIGRTLRTVPLGGTSEGLFSFGQAFGNWRNFQRDGRGVAKADVRNLGALGGIGFGGGNFALGAFVGYADGRQDIDDVGARNDADGIFAGAMGRYSSGPIRAGLSFVWDDSSADTSRSLFNGDRADAHYKLRGATLDGFVGYDFDIGGGWRFGPEAGLTYVTVKRGAISEGGGSAFALQLDSQRYDATFVSGDLSLSHPVGSAWRPYLSAGVRYMVDGDAIRAAGSFAGTPGAYSVLGAERDETLVNVGAGFEVDIVPSITLFAHGDSEFGADNNGRSLNGGVRVGF